MNQVRAIVFEGSRTASKAFFKLEEEGSFNWLNEVAVVSRDKLGFIRVHSTWAQDDRNLVGGIGLGTLTGAAVGALLGPQGAVAGAVGAGAIAGGSLGGMFSAGIEIALTDERLEHFASRLGDDSSALILVSNPERADEFVSAFAPYEGEVIETQLNEHDINALSEALKAADQRG